MSIAPNKTTRDRYAGRGDVDVVCAGSTWVLVAELMLLHCKMLQ